MISPAVLDAMVVDCPAEQVADARRARYAAVRGRLMGRPIGAGDHAEFVERHMSLYRRSTEQLAAILGCKEHEVWNLRASMDDRRRK